MADIVLVACDNGFGHLVRTVQIANFFACRAFDVTLIRGNVLPAFPFLDANVKQHILPYQLKPTCFELTPIDIFLTLIPPRISDILSTSCHVYSDGIPHFSRFNTNFSLFSNFFWPLVDLNFSSSYDSLVHLLSGILNIYSFSYFVCPHVTQMCKPTLVPFNYKYFNSRSSMVVVENDNSNNLLISVGASRRYNPFDYPMPEERDLACNFSVIYVEPSLLSIFISFYPSLDIRAASYDNSFYRQVSRAIVRPGLGTIYPLMAFEVRFVCVGESNNVELAHNARMVHTLMGSAVPLFQSVANAFTTLKSFECFDKVSRDIWFSPGLPSLESRLLDLI